MELTHSQDNLQSASWSSQSPDPDPNPESTSSSSEIFSVQESRRTKNKYLLPHLIRKGENMVFQNESKVNIVFKEIVLQNVGK